MKVSKILLVGLSGFAVVYAAKRILNRKTIVSAVHDIFFDTEFIPGTGKINQFIPDNPEMRNWFRTRQAPITSDADEALFI